MSELPDWFMDRIRVDEDSGCWLWTGTITAKGYPTFERDGREVRAHRFAYARMVGEPGDCDVHHECPQRSCVNPAHLELLTHQEHAALHARRPMHCPQGHAYDEANTYRYGNHRLCRTCNRERSRARYQARVGRSAGTERPSLVRNLPEPLQTDKEKESCDSE